MQNKSTPKISVVIPAFNAEDFISETLSSVLAQSYNDIEILVIDDCSQDATCEIVEQFIRRDPRIQLHKQKQNSGMPGAMRNIGVSKASGQFIAFIDADDLWHVEKLQLQLDAAESTGARLISSEMLDFNESIDINLFASAVSPRLRKITLLDQIMKYQTPTSSLMINCHVFDELKFSEDFAVRGREDLLFSIDFHKKYRESIKIISPLVFYRRHSNQISSDKLKMVFLVLKIIVTRNYGPYWFYKLFLPFLVCSNLFLSVYYRLVKGRL